jgi:hypothetical protein
MAAKLNITMSKKAQGTAPLNGSRRPTPCQKAAIEALTLLKDDLTDKLQWHCLMVAHPFGELAPMLRICQDIYDNRLPVSPTDFQHAVANAVASTISRMHQFDGPCYTFSASLNAFSQMQEATQRWLILYPDKNVLCLNVEEKPQAELAKVEAFLCQSSHHPLLVNPTLETWFPSHRSPT